MRTAPVTAPPNTIDATLLSLLRCPQTGEQLRPATPGEVDAANGRIAAGELRDASGEIVAEPLGGGLMTLCGSWLYPVRDQIPTMIPEEAIAADQLQPE